MNPENPSKQFSNSEHTKDSLGSIYNYIQRHRLGKLQEPHLAYLMILMADFIHAVICWPGLDHTLSAGGWLRRLGRFSLNFDLADITRLDLRQPRRATYGNSGW